VRRAVIPILLALVLVLATVSVSGQTVTFSGWSRDATWDLGIPDYMISALIADDDASSLIVVPACNITDFETGVVKVLSSDFTELESYDIAAGCGGGATAIDVNGDIIALANEYYTEVTLFVINRTSGTVASTSIQSIGGPDYNVDALSIAVVDRYVYVLVWDEYGAELHLRIYVFDISGAAPTRIAIINESDVVRIARIENSNYLVYWNGSNTIYILDGADPNLTTVVASFDIAIDAESVDSIVGYYNESDNTVIIAFDVIAYDEFRIVRYDMTNGVVIYDISILSPSGDAFPIYDISAFNNTVYLVTAGGVGFRVLDAFTSSPTVVVEALPYGSYVHLCGSEYLYTIDGMTAVARYVYVTSGTVTHTVTETVTQTVVIYEGETTTITTTLPVEGGYTSEDLFLVGLAAFFLALAMGFVLARR